MAANGPSKCSVWGAGSTLPRERKQAEEDLCGGFHIGACVRGIEESRENVHAALKSSFSLDANESLATKNRLVFTFECSAMRVQVEQ